MLLNGCSATACQHCSASGRWVLHSVHREGALLRLCTSCVLRLHPHSFCPSCFAVHLQGPPPDALRCSNCASLSHTSCAGPHPPKTPFLCPMCHCPNGMRKKKAGDFDGSDARVLEAGFAISCFTMSEAALDKRCEAERRAREAVHTRKRAKQALEHMAGVVAREKLRRKENGAGVMERRDSVGNGAGSLEKNQVVGNLERLEMSSNGVLATEECREKEAGSGGIRPQSNGAAVDVDVDALRDVSLGSSLDVGDASGENHGGGVVCEISRNLDQLNQSAERNLVSNSIVVLPPLKEDQSQVMENCHLEQNNNCLKH